MIFLAYMEEAIGLNNQGAAQLDGTRGALWLPS